MSEKRARKYFDLNKVNRSDCHCRRDDDGSHRCTVYAIHFYHSRKVTIFVDDSASIGACVRACACARARQFMHMHLILATKKIMYFYVFRLIFTCLTCKSVRQRLRRRPPSKHFNSGKSFQSYSRLIFGVIARGTTSLELFATARIRFGRRVDKFNVQVRRVCV